jgi:hypothetical protein
VSSEYTGGRVGGFFWGGFEFRISNFELRIENAEQAGFSQFFIRNSKFEILDSVLITE